MGIRLDVPAETSVEVRPLDRALRIAMVIYLSPVILAVLAVGVVGMVASSFGKPTARVAGEGLHSSHKLSRPLGLVRKPAPVREKV